MQGQACICSGKAWSPVEADIPQSVSSWEGLLGVRHALQVRGNPERMLCSVLTEGEKLEITRQWWHMTLIPALGRQRQVELCEFTASLAYRGSSRITRETHCLEKNKKGGGRIRNNN